MPSARVATTSRELAPTDLASGLKFAFDGDTTVNASGVASQWTDLSGNANHATAAGTAKPAVISNSLNGHSILRFDGVDDGFTVPAVALGLTGAFTWIAVFSTTSASSDGTLFANGVNVASCLAITHHNAANPWFYVSNGNNINGALSSGIWTIARVTWDGTQNVDSMLMRFVGVINARKQSSFSGALTTAFDYSIGKLPAGGGGGFYIGDMASQSLWTGVLPEGQALAVERYLSRRYNITTF